MLQNKNTVAKMKYASKELINTLGMVKERINEFEEMSIETSKTEAHEEKRWKRQNRIFCPFSVPDL